MTALYSGTFLPLGVLVWPLLVGLVAMVVWSRGALWVLPLAPVPALGFAVAGAPGSVVVPDLLLGVHLGIVPGGALLLGMTALVWTVAGMHAALTLRAGPQAAVFAGFWCVTLAGNLGVFLAGDIVTFYLAFAAVSLAAWFLVIHERTQKALAAGRQYITLAVLGEAALLVGLMIGAAAAEDLHIASVRAALVDAPLGPLGVAALVLGFGIKAGMVPLHLWLPVAHPAAPVPGSAVLSGAIVNAGLIGMMLFVPDGTGWGDVLVAAGLVGGFGAALWGLTQRNPKAVLAYSTISQMGLMLMLVGAGSAGVAYYAFHHGLAKAALFLCVGVMAAAQTPRQRGATLGLVVLVALSVAGLPLTGGGVAKLAGKQGLPDALSLVLTLSSMTTTLVLVWFVLRLAQAPAPPLAPSPLWRSLFAGAAVLGGLALVAPWAVWGHATGLPTGYPAQPANMFAGIWPLLAGLGAAALIPGQRLPEYPPGDILALLRWRGGGWSGRAGAARSAAPRRHWRRAVLRALLHVRRLETHMRPWPCAGWVLIVTALTFSGLVLWTL